MNFPSNVKYHREHTWLNVENTIGTIGITDFAQSELGEIVFVDLPDTGKIFKQGDIFGSIEALKTVSDLFMPVSGKVIEINKPLWLNPAWVNSDPFDKGWMIKIELIKPDEIEGLLSIEAYQALVT
ncbi:glycine cleavage system protein GcvH [Ferruginibacter sp. HRS2-29]|uniref:glycine cleavage system protein GcvH n=1 Tax=Ferruginibacter sp. HRS2-29 TaxID=2487334 RepID=UPI0020CF2313|nr:glycine cleavage system protein GcvH [Ferruginibacter sp. HRS2-29]MCP9749353.1 glycine cleavage system protein GcvH [Ferruginibacter sp. HRS2-29]